MEPYGVVLLGAGLSAVTLYVGWLTKMVFTLSQAVSAIQSKQDSYVEEHNYLRNRVDEMAYRG